MTEIAADKYLLIAAQVQRTDLIVHTVLGDHPARQIVGAERSRSLGGNIAQGDLFRHMTAQQLHDLIVQPRAGDIVLLLVGHGHGIAACAAARDDGHLVHGIAAGQHIRQHGVTRLMIGDQRLVSSR